MKIFQIQSGQVVINENILLIPYLRIVHDKFPKERMKVLSYIHYSTLNEQENPYSNIQEELREDRIRKDFSGFNHDDDDIQYAIKRIKEKYVTVVDRLLANARKSVEVMSDKIVSMTELAMNGSAKDAQAALNVLRGLSDLGEIIKHLDELQKTQGGASKKKIAYDQLT